MSVPNRQIGWSQESNLLWQILKQLNRLTSIMFGLKPNYKVYTALLSQNGSGNVFEITGGDLTVGVAYTIFEASGGAEGYDFTNVGAPNNDLGTIFTATGTTPASWGNNNVGLYYNTGAPVATVLENTIGNIWFTYNSSGEYKCNSANLFTLNKTTIDIDNYGQDGNPAANIFTNTNISEDRFTIFTDKGGPQDDVLIKNRLEIRVYN